MKVRALQDCYVNNTFRKGAEYDLNDSKVGDGEIFEVPDTYPINPEVLQVIEEDPPAVEGQKAAAEQKRSAPAAAKVGSK